MMHRRGHVGVAMLAYAPVGFVLLAERQLGLALLGLFGVLAVEPLPDNDMWIPFLDHRETSHSLFCALAVGGVIGTLGWLIGGWMAGFFIGLDASAVGVFAGVFQLVGEQFRGLDASALARFGFAVGFFGILAHLLGDVITVSGIRPLLPLSRWQLSLSRLRADNSIANNALFGLGVVGLLLVAFATAPGVGLAAAAADLSPVGVASAQSANASGNQTTASVVFTNQTTNGSTVTIERVTLPDNGFVAVHTGGYATGPAPATGSVIAVSQHLSAGTHRNVTINISHAPPSNAPGLNRTRLNESQTLAAVAYQDTNDNHRFDFVSSFGKQDRPFTANGSTVKDSARISAPTPPRQTASVVFHNQTLGDASVTVASARLPKGGFLVIHNESYLSPENATLESAVGVTAYLESGKHSSVRVPLLEGAVTTNQTLVAVVYRDTNGNQRYDYIASSGFRDVAYLNRTSNQTVVVNDTAAITVESTETPTATPTATTTPIDITTPFRVTNLSVSNRSAHVGDEVTVTVWIENPTDKRLKSEIALATAGTAVETQEVALFPRGRRAVHFTHTYEAPGQYVVKVANRTEQIRIVEEGAPLTPPTTTSGANQSVQSQSSGAVSLSDIPIPVIVLLVLGVGGVFYVLRRR
jgi:membrane-bound metal-dependent hydrolase YbcI (DUF457 family)